MYNNCCCSMAGTKACLTCPNSMSGVGDRYPAPYQGLPWPEKIWPEKFVEPEWKRQQEESRSKMFETLKLIQEAKEAAGESKAFFGRGIYLLVDSSDEELALAEQVGGV